MSRLLLCCVLALAVHSCSARRVQSKKGEMEVHEETAGFGTAEAAEFAKACNSQYDVNDPEGRISCMCDKVNGLPECEKGLTSCCMKMTMQGFKTPGVKPWACMNLKGKCQPMFPGGGRRIKPRLPPKPKVTTAAPSNPVVEEKQNDVIDPKKDEDLLPDDLDLEEEDDLDLDDGDDIPNVKDNEEGDSKEEDTAEDDDGKIKHCEQIEDVAERALCICNIADTPEKCTGKLAQAVKEKSDPWTCAIHPVEKSCGPVKPVDPVPTKAPEPEKPQPKDCTGSVEDADWWTANRDYYSTVFTVGAGTGEYGGDGKVLSCNFVSKKHDCLKGAYTKKTGLQVSTVLEKKKGIKIHCGFDGKWLEPSNKDRQTCAYPLVPKDLKRKAEDGGIIDAGDKVDRVLTIKDGKVEVLQWTGGYDLNQLFVLQPTGLIKSLAADNKCLSGMDPNNYFFTKSGWLEGYLQLHSCEKNGHTDEDQIWWLRPDMGDFVRDQEKAGACAMPNSCCSFAYAKTASPGTKDYLTYPQVEEEITDAFAKDYRWLEDGKVQEWSPYKILFGAFGTGIKKRDIGYKSAGGGYIDKPNADQVNSRIDDNFKVVAENRPKVLNFLKMSMKDAMHTILDFWKL